MDPLGEDRQGERWLLFHSSRSPGLVARWMARTRDVIFSVTLLTALSPLFLILSVLVKLSSPGPVFFSALVVGKNGQRFRWRKFRSMKLMSEDEDIQRRRASYQAYVEGKNLKEAGRVPGKVIDEKRVTAVGRFLRKYSLDELPQLWNVLRGEMAFVGPRPCLPYEAEFCRGWRQRRFDVKPGLTGVWQVFGRGKVGFDEAMAMDVFYLHRRSLIFDFFLMMKTIKVTLRGSGAV